MLNSIIDNKNIGLLKNLYQLRQELDVYSLISANAGGINRRSSGRYFFGFLQQSCVNLIALDICKIYEYQKNYELNSIEGVLKHIKRECITGLNSPRIYEFANKYGHKPNGSDVLSALSSTVKDFKMKYRNELERFKTCRDKRVAHSELDYNVDSLPSYDVMERLFSFGDDFYKLVSTDFVSTDSVSVVPCDLNSYVHRRVRTDFRKLLQELGLKNVTEL